MEKEITLKGRSIPYTLRDSSRARSINITLDYDGSVIVSLPKNLKLNHAESFLKEKEDWVLSTLERIEKYEGIYLGTQKGRELEFLKSYASAYVSSKVKELNENYSFRINKISIRNNKSQWGSCTAKGNLSFTYKIVLLPKELAEYVVLHELCHLGEFSHGEKFWNLVNMIVSDGKKLDKQLRRYHL